MGRLSMPSRRRSRSGRAMAELQVDDQVTVRRLYSGGDKTTRVRVVRVVLNTTRPWFEWIAWNDAHTGSTGGIGMIDREGLDWARGWGTPEANALATAVALT